MNEKIKPLKLWKIVKKPVQETTKGWNYFECEKWVAYKLGIDNLYNIQYEKKGNTKRLQDFWCCICMNQKIFNGCHFEIHTDLKLPDWAIPIVQMFEQEFGPNATYWVEW